MLFRSFGACSQRLKPNGRMALQAIVIGDQRFDRAMTSEDFIKRFVFPGGCIPSVQAILASTSRSTDLALIDLEDFGRHYAETLARWRTQLHSNRDELIERGYDEPLLRLWDFYLCYCEGAFLERHVSVMQAVFVKPDWRPNGLGARQQ